MRQPLPDFLRGGATFLCDLPFDLFIVGLCVILPQISIYHFDWLHPSSREKPFLHQVLRESSHRWKWKSHKKLKLTRNCFSKCSVIFQIVFQVCFSFNPRSVIDWDYVNGKSFKRSNFGNDGHQRVQSAIYFIAIITQ